MKKNYKIKKTISIKQFISEFGESLSKHMKKRLLDLEVRSVLTRKEDNYRLDLKHVEHTQYNANSNTCKKEYAYASFIIIDDTLYFSEKCLESDTVMQSPIVNTIYNNLDSANMVCDKDINAKLVDDDNIDYIIDTILTVCPDVSQKYIDIVHQMTSLAESSTRGVSYGKLSL
ncbi:hypothetical protein RBU49_10270 [Clostridium sp. MB40-C1]|uniref:hypothetical protein n=1 Tax=Clostridium sp. MB40-C1 TaxID=3070996 RepID=UPI0027DF5E73|nr:hypothetical protein [Clostridium sp. MB40-C1]WMJ79274.1 hypothetical protein RBU49_10270 [Clostridium sp. MB40-C1]